MKLKRFIVFLIRKRLGLKNYEPFRFSNQKSSALYYFTPIGVMKSRKPGFIEPSGVSLNWLLDDDCEIKKCVGGDGWS